MKKIKTTVFVVILMVLSTFAIAIAAEAAFIKNEQKNIKDDSVQPLLFDAEITFYIYTGEGCACTPITGATVSAIGGEGNDSGITDEDGMCILTLVILGEYEVTIEAEGYQPINFEFNVVDDQTFTFHLLEEEESSAYAIPLFHHLITKLFN